MRAREWRDRADCIGIYWLSDIDAANHPRAREGRNLCGGCPVQEECLGDALARDERHGMRAGLTPQERSRRHPRPVEPTQPRTDSGKWSEGRILDDATRRDIIALTHDGLTASQIAERLGVRLRSVTYVRATQPLSGPSWTEREVRVAALRSGPEPLPIRQVAAELGMSRAVVARVALRVSQVPEQRQGSLTV